MKFVSASALAFSPVSGLSLDETRRELVEVRRQQALLNARVLELVSHLDALASGDTPVVTLPHRELMTHAGLSPREASAAIARAEVTDVAPAFGSLLATGATSTGHLDAMARAFATLGDERHKIEPLLPDLVSAAESMTVGEFAKLATNTARSLLDDGGLSTFEKQRASTYLTMKRDSEGGFSISGYFDPERGAALVAAIESRREAKFHAGDPLPKLMPWVTPNDHRNALALVDMVAQSSVAGYDGPTAPRAEVVVHIDLQTLTDGLHEHSDCRTVYGADIPAETVRRLACEAHIIPVVLNGEGIPIDVGRSRRLATATQRRALETIHKTCAIPECDTPYHHCQIHHIDYWENGGPSDLDNLVPLCSRHHHLAHEGRWTLSLDATTRAVTFEPPRA